MSIDIRAGHPVIVTIPPGVAHGIGATTRLLYLYGLSVAYDGSDEDLGCRYDDPSVGVRWSLDSPTVLGRDLDLPDFATMVRRYARAASRVEQAAA